MSNAGLKHRDSFKPKLIALSVAACFSLSATQTSANPTGGRVVSGSASFSASGNSLTITNTAGAIINWQSFSIGVNEITRFIQSSSSSSVLNRVVGKNGVVPQSVIDGVLTSNGRVFLLNSSGILFGQGARIDVAGLVASSLNLSNQDFRAGKMKFTETPGAGPVSNAGVIDTTSGGPGGRVFLVAPDVKNTGIIRTPQGQIVLAAGKSVELVSENSPFVTVTITADTERALNLGKLIADSGRIGMFGGLVRQGGVAQANSAVVGANGEIRLVATKDLTLDEGSTTTANGPSGGNITLQAQGGTNLVYGTVEAKGGSGQGGTIEALGVRVGVVGHGVIDASGDTGGGTVLVGGDAHGANPNVQNAERTLIGPDGVIRADAGTTGDGGRVVLWADGDTRFYGSVSARGGAQSGNGGFIETSGKLGLDVEGGRVDARAANGLGGTWLLDPVDVTIISGVNLAPGTDPAVGIGAPIGVDNFAATPVNGGVITSGTLETNFLNVGTTRIQATNDVLFKSDLKLVYGTVTPVQTFEVRAVRNINLAADGVAHTITTNGQHVVLSANDNGNPQLPPGLNTASGTGSILGLVGGAGGGKIITNGGNITLSGYGVNVGDLSTSPINPIIVGAGNVSVLSYAGDIVTGAITTHAVSPLTAQVSPGGSVALSTSYGNILVNGTIDTSGAKGFDTRSSNQGTAGGDVSFIRSSQTQAGAITVYGDIFTYGGSGVPSAATGNVGGLGGNGGSVAIFGGTIVGTAGLITLPAYGTISVTGSIKSRGGDASYGLAAGSAGGVGGNGGAVLIYGDVTHTVNVGAIDTSGGLGAAGSVSAPALGGAGGSGGAVNVQGGSITISGSITAPGGAGGNGSDSVTIGLTGGAGGNGGGSGLVQVIGTQLVVVSGDIDVSTGNGGSGGSGPLSYGGSGGNGGTPPIMNAAFFRAPVINVGSISAQGGAGGAGGSGGGRGGIGAGGGVVQLETGTSTQTGFTFGTSAAGSINASGGAGGAGGYGGGIGGDGGTAGGASLNGDPISAGAITARGGNGGAGGAGVGLIPGGIGGKGGGGGSVTMLGVSTANVDGVPSVYGSVAVGNIDASGGNGGAGGKGVGSALYAGDGGLGGNGGTVRVTGSVVDLTTGGSLLAPGGSGGSGGNGDPGNGGAGGYGGFVDLFSQSTISVVTQPTTSVSGGTGGAGGVDTVGTGLKGLDGLPGSFQIFGTLVFVDPSLGLAGNTVIQGTNQLIPTNLPPSPEDLEKKQKESKQKKEVACK